MNTALTQIRVGRKKGSTRKNLYLCRILENTTIMDKKSYAFGMSVASSFYQQGIHVNNVEDFLKGLKDMLTGTKPEISMEEAGEIVEKWNQYYY